MVDSSIPLEERETRLIELIRSRLSKAIVVAVWLTYAVETRQRNQDGRFDFLDARDRNPEGMIWKDLINMNSTFSHRIIFLHKVIVLKVTK